MGTAITPQLVDVVDTFTAERSYSSGGSSRLTFCQMESWGLRMECPTPDDPFADSAAIWLIPDIGLRLTHRHPRSRHAHCRPPTLTAVRVHWDTRYWRTTDLLLGLSVPGGTTARIVGAEDFAAAVSGGVLRTDDADLALRIVHRALEELSGCYHNMVPWLTHHRIRTPWPPL